MNAWGFKFKTVAFVWIKMQPECSNLEKPKLGMGFYTRSNAEICLLGMKGTLKKMRHDIYQVQKANVKEHSSKPTRFRNEIVKLFGDIPRIELFARNRVVGWDCWGNEVPIESENPTLSTYV